MSNVDFSLNAEIRTDAGKGASRRLRRAGKVPAILYGAKEEPQSLTLNHTELMNHIQHEAFFSHILTINVGKEKHQAIMKDMQRHPYKPIVLHVDLLRVKANELLRVNVPLHFINESTSVGVKQGGGIVSHNMTQLEVFVLPKDLPEYIEVDVANLNIGEALHISDLKLPQGVESVELSHGPEHDLAVVSIHHPRVQEEVEPEAEASAEVPTVGDEKKDKDED